MNKNTTSKNSLILFFAAIAAAILSVSLRLVNLFVFFDFHIGYYTSGAVLPTVSDILLLCFAVFFAVFSIIGIRKEAPQIYREPKRLYLRISLRVLGLAMLLLVLASSYFNQKIQMNAPDKILLGIACVFSMIFIANDLKALVGTQRRSTYGIFAALTLLFASTASVPSIIAYHAKVLTTSDGIYFEYYLILAMAIYAAIRLYPRRSKAENAPAAEVTEESAKEDQKPDGVDSTD